ncbi:hypothetical protein HanPSC8_Chr06g0250091 [Helianthus annuus]|nr:hypothetical protein HanPSC8_Chr06g0250091 [Helianthus annuus]
MLYESHISFGNLTISCQCLASSTHTERCTSPEEIKVNLDTTEMFIRLKVKATNVSLITILYVKKLFRPNADPNPH